MSQDGDWTPFCVPFSWYKERSLCWRCPQCVHITCVVDGVVDSSPPLASIVRRDKQLGFRVIPNNMSQAREFIGMHLLDVDKDAICGTNPAAVTFFLTRGPCPCTQRPPHPQQQQQQQQGAPAVDGLAGAVEQLGLHPRSHTAAEGAEGARGSVPAAGLVDGGYAGSGSRSGNSSSSEDGGPDNSDDGDDDDGGGGVGVEGRRRRGGAAAGGRERGGRRGGGRAAGGRGPVPIIKHGPGAPLQRHCRCPCHARHLTQVLVSREQAEEMEERRAERPYRKQQVKGAGGADAAATTAAAGRSSRPLGVNVPRMSAAPSELDAAAAAAVVRPPRPRPRARHRPNTHRGAGAAATPAAPTTATPMTAAATTATTTPGAAAAADAAAASPVSESAVIPLGRSVCSTPAKKEWSNIGGRIVSTYFPGRTCVRVAVEADGVLLPNQKPYHMSKLSSYNANRRIHPTPPLAVGKLCVGWGLLEEEDGVLVMRVSTRMPEGPSRRVNGDVAGAQPAAHRKRTAAEAGLDEAAGLARGAKAMVAAAAEVEGIAGAEGPAKPGSKERGGSNGRRREGDVGDGVAQGGEDVGGWQAMGTAPRGQGAEVMDGMEEGGGGGGGVDEDDESGSTSSSSWEDGEDDDDLDGSTEEEDEEEEHGVLDQGKRGAVRLK